MKEETYMNIELREHTDCKILQAKGIHYFKALKEARQDASGIIASLMTQLLIVDGKKATQDMLNNMPIDELSYISEIISIMLDKKYADGV